MDFSTEAERLLGDRARLTSRPGLGVTLEATRPILPGELILSDTPLLVASSASSLSPAARVRYEEAGDSGDYNLDDLLILHAFVRAGERVRRRVLEGFCAEECCEPGHAMLLDAERCAAWARTHDAAASGQHGAADLARACVVFTLNCFGHLADGVTGGAPTLFWLASKFTHRCLRPNSVFHGEGGRLHVRAVRPIAKCDVLTISYLGVWAHCAAPLRRGLLMRTKGFRCRCEDCAAPDVMRSLPCPACAPRDGATGLLVRAERTRGTAGCGARRQATCPERSVEDVFRF